MLKEKSSSFQLVARNQSAPTPSEKVENNISNFGTAFERFLTECWWFLSWVFVGTHDKPFCEPEVEEVDDVFKDSISHAYFFVEYLCKVSHIRRYVWFSS